MTPTPAQSDRQEAILNAAFHAFSTYGFRRTTMEDIARAAGLSRTAMYLHFRNKEDLFRRMAGSFFDGVNREVTRILATPSTDPAATLMAAMRAKDGKFMDAVLGTPHGAELMDAGASIAADIAAEGEAIFQARLAAWIAMHAVPPDLGSPEDMAATLMSALKGVKSGSRTLTDYRSAQGMLARIFGRAMIGAQEKGAGEGPLNP